MRFFFIVSVLLALSGCVVVVDTKVYQTPPVGYLSDREKWEAQNSILYLYRNEISRGFHSRVATARVYGKRNYAGGMCFEQQRQGALVYMCTTRWFLDPVSFYERITVRLQPQGAYGLVAPVYIAGPIPAAYSVMSPSFEGGVRYKGTFQPSKKRRQHHSPRHWY